jgi:hypothetical protein
LARAKSKPGKGGYVCSKREATQELKNRSIDAQAMSELREHAVPRGQRQIERGIDRHAAQMAARLPRDGKHRAVRSLPRMTTAHAREDLFSTVLTSGHSVWSPVASCRHSRRTAKTA